MEGGYSGLVSLYVPVRKWCSVLLNLGTGNTEV
nr:MAG TPA: hypothetical protein [Caudoviricetes sp.]DAX86682.1 MAG TPA: hypothetical protein [Caudoviricetes sp.]